MLLVVLALLTLVALLALLVTARRTGVGGAVALLAVSVLWILVNQPLEGPVLLRISQSHGFTTADVLAVIGGGVAVLRLWHLRGRRRP